MREDISTVFEKDPAAKSFFEVLTCYPGLHAVWFHRIAHWFYKRHDVVMARLISHVGRFLTGIEIHPGATIGKRFFIDHGMGVVIGETTEIGDDVLLYQGVVLGGTSHEKKKRHPTLGNNVVVGTGAAILGALNIGSGARIGAGSVVISDIPPDATAVGVPARVGVGFTEEHLKDLEHGKLPDPVADAIKLVLREHDKIEERVMKLEKMEGVISKIDERLEAQKKTIEKVFATPQAAEFSEGGGI
ncbi:serine O-acetyltransferase [bacterium]|nr:serine O-acetyltransferase [bacterium]